MTRLRLAFACALAAALVAGCGGDEKQAPEGKRFDASAISDPGPIHVHGLGINPADGALFIATHTGLFRAGGGEDRAKRVAERYQDTMGFTIVGRDRFLGSGHPDLREKLPPFLGLIESRDAGRTWKPVSLLGKRDFHVLEASGRRVYGFGSDFETRQAGLMVSDDDGRTWEDRDAPEALLSLAIDPADPDKIVASGEEGMYASKDTGRGWRPVAGAASLLAWPARGDLFAIAFDGSVSRSADRGRNWRVVGALDGEPAAFEAPSAQELYAALHDGTIMRSVDGGRSWSVRSKP